MYALDYLIRQVGKVGKVFRGSHCCYENCISFGSLVFRMCVKREKPYQPAEMTYLTYKLSLFFWKV